MLAPPGDPRTAPGGKARSPFALEFAAVVAFTIYAIWPFVRTDRWVTGFDTVAYAGPNLHLTLAGYRAGRFVQWNDDIFGGIGHLANPQAGVLYLPKVPFAWLETHRALLLLVVVHVLWLAVGTLVLVRRGMRLEAPAGTFAAIAVVSSGMVATKSMQFEQLLVVAWVPWLLLAVEAVVAARTWAWSVPSLAVTTAFMLTAGHPQMVFIVAPLAVAWSLGRMADHRAWNRALPLGVGALSGLLLAAPQLLPTLHLVSQTAAGDRQLSSATGAGYSIYPSLLPTTLLGNVGVSNLGFTSNGFENAAFLGVVAVVVALLGFLGMVVGRGRRWTGVLLSAAAAAALLLALGPRTAPYRLAFGVVPGFSLARVPARWTVVVTFAVAVLAAHGIAMLRRRAPAWIVWATTAGVTVGSVAMTGTMQLPEAGVVAVWVVLAVLVLGCAGGAVLRPPAALALGLVMTVGLAVEGGLAQRQSFARTSLADRPFTELDGSIEAFLSGRPERVVALTYDKLGDAPYLVASLRPNANVAFDIPSIDGYDGGIQVTRRWVKEIDALVETPVNAELTLRSQVQVPLDPESYAAFGVRWAVVDAEGRDVGSVVGGWRGPVITEGTLSVWENPAHRGPAVLDPTSGARAEVVRAESGRIDVRTTSDRGGTLSVPSQFDDGWSATLDGKAVDVSPRPGLRLAVDVPPGPHEVRLRYRAPGLSAGLGLCALAAVVLVAIVLRDRQGRGSKRAPIEE